jgi:hypothetical protein
MTTGEKLFVLFVMLLASMTAWAQPSVTAQHVVVNSGYGRLPIHFESAGAQVASLQFDMQFDQAYWVYTDYTGFLINAPAAGDALAGRNVSSRQIGNGLYRIIVTPADGRAAIMSGEIVTVDFSIVYLDESSPFVISNVVMSTNADTPTAVTPVTANSGLVVATWLAGQDYDGDGVADYDEVALGSDPLDAGDVTNAPFATAPTFQPGSGTVLSSDYITLASSTAGARIYFTTDGSMPVAHPIHEYGMPFQVSDGTVVKAIAVADGYVTSPVASATFNTIADTDNDGLPDEWEMAHFGTLDHDGSEDSDGDGMTNLEEYLARRNPGVNEAAVLLLINRALE